MADRIGSFTFLRIDGEFPRAKLGLSLERRSGVDGIVIKGVGAAGMPFTVRTKAWAVSYDAALDLPRQYETLIALSAVTAGKGGSVEPQQYYKVLDVRSVSVRAMIGGRIAGDSTTYLAECICDWDLVPIDPRVQPP